MLAIKIDNVKLDISDKEVSKPECKRDLQQVTSNQ